MATTLNAGFVYSSEDDDVVIVGFADKEYETEHYVLLQRSKQVSAEEEALGQGEVHISTDDPSRASYGGIESVLLGASEVMIRLEQGTARLLGVDEEIAIRFDCEAVDVARLRDGLRLLFGRSGVLSEAPLH